MATTSLRFPFSRGPPSLGFDLFYKKLANPGAVLAGEHSGCHFASRVCLSHTLALGLRKVSHAGCPSVLPRTCVQETSLRAAGGVAVCHQGRESLSCFPGQHRVVSLHALSCHLPLNSLSASLVMLPLAHAPSVLDLHPVMPPGCSGWYHCLKITQSIVASYDSLLLWVPWLQRSSADVSDAFTGQCVWAGVDDFTAIPGSRRQSVSAPPRLGSQTMPHLCALHMASPCGLNASQHGG